jgi:hypothetical protein
VQRSEISEALLNAQNSINIHSTTLQKMLNITEITIDFFLCENIFSVGTFKEPMKDRFKLVSNGNINGFRNSSPA